MSTNEPKKNLFHISVTLKFPHFSRTGNDLQCSSKLAIQSNIPVDAEKVVFRLNGVEIPGSLTVKKKKAPGDGHLCIDKEYEYEGRLQVVIPHECYRNIRGRRFIMMEIPYEDEFASVRMRSRWFYGRHTAAVLEKTFHIEEDDLTAYLLVQSAGLNVTVREYAPEDSFSHRVKIAFAFLLSRFWFFRHPIVMYEKKAERYEESAAVLFERLIDSQYRNVYYILDGSCPYADSIKPQYRKKIVTKYSFHHYLVFFAARAYVGTENVVHLIGFNPLNKYLRYKVYRSPYDFVFLQHGVMYMVSLDAQQRGFFRQTRENGRTRIIVSSKLEAAHFMNQGEWPRKSLYISGIPKYDRNTLDEKADRIAIMLTWRPWEEAVCREDVRETSYYKSLVDILAAIPESYLEHVMIMPHPLFASFMADLETPLTPYMVQGEKYDDLLKTTRILITDYSSISYDAFYRGANVIFDWTEKDECIMQYGENAKLMLTQERAFGDVCYQREELADAIRKNYTDVQDPEYVRRYQKLVEFHDGKNTDRVIDCMIADGILAGKGNGEKKSEGGKKKEEKIGRIRGALNLIRPELAFYHDEMRKPLLEDTILLEAAQGKNTNGNMFALLAEIENDPKWESLQPCFVVSESTSGNAREKFERYGFGRTKLVTIHSREYLSLLATAKYLFTDNSFPSYYIKRDGQVVLNTWHGTPLKQLGRSCIAESTSIANIQKNYAISDYVLFPNRYTRDIFYQDYMLDALFDGTILLEDYPRNGRLLADDAEKERRKEEFGIAGKKVYAYMPTWRGAGRTVDEAKQLARTTGILYELDQYLTDDEVLLVNLHFLLDNSIDYTELKHIKRFSDLYDSYDVLAVCDVLVTDYSSVFFDTATIDMPTILFAYDMEQYLEEKGTYFDMRTLPYPIVSTVAELLEELRKEQRFDSVPYAEYKERFCSFADPDASKKVLDLIINGKAEGITTEERHAVNDAVLLYGGTLADPKNQNRIRKKIREIGEEEKVILIYTDAIADTVGDFLASLPPKIQFIRLLKCFFDSKKEAAAAFRYSFNGKESKALQRIMDREWDLQLKYIHNKKVLILDDAKKNALLFAKRLSEGTETE